MSMVDYRPIYMAKNRKRATSEATIKKCIMYPTLMRRLVCLHEDKVKLDDVKENPWHTEMTNANISLETVKDARDFVNFCYKEDEKKQSMYAY